jgi:hypothetical protein
MALPGRPEQWTCPKTVDRVTLRRFIYTSQALVPFEPAPFPRKRGQDRGIRLRASGLVPAFVSLPRSAVF